VELPFAMVNLSRLTLAGWFDDIPFSSFGFPRKFQCTDRQALCCACIKALVSTIAAYALENIFGGTRIMASIAGLNNNLTSI
jgi:hypothetical protein